MQPERRSRIIVSGRRQFLVGGAAFGAMLWAGGPPLRAGTADRSGQRALTAAFAAMGSDLYAELSRKPGNFVFSPFSIGVAMAMTLSGARGATEAELAKVLRLPLPRTAMEDACAEAAALLNAYDRSSDPRFCPDGARWSGSACEAAPSGGRCQGVLDYEGD